MIDLSRRAIGAAGIAVGLTATSVWAQQAQTVRVRGEIEKIDGNTLTVKSRTGETLTIKLAEPPRISAMTKATLADVKQGAFIGVSAMPQPDGMLRAFAIHIFMDAQRGVVPDRHSEWDSRPGATMTNANVETTVTGNDGQNLVVKYKDGEKKVVVPPGTPIARTVPGNPSDLKVGAKIFVAAARRQPDGTLAAPNVSVGRDIDPPQ